MGAIPKGMFVCHRCDNTGCVRLEHLFLGTRSDNMVDMYNKRRGYHKRLSPEEKKIARSIANKRWYKKLRARGGSK